MSAPYPDTHHDISSNTIFGFWVYLMTDFILFGTLFASYAVLSGSAAGGPGPKEIFVPSFALQETLLLLTSSFASGLALISVNKQEKYKTLLWYSLAFLLGLLFLRMQTSEFSHLIHEGNTWKTSAFLSAYFTLIGTHGLHILGGLFFMLLFLVQLLLRGFTPAVVRRFTCLSMFWFFSYVVWVFMFILVYLLGLV